MTKAERGHLPEDMANEVYEMLLMDEVNNIANLKIERDTCHIWLDRRFSVIYKNAGYFKAESAYQSWMMVNEKLTTWLKNETYTFDSEDGYWDFLSKL